jgi:ubiquitin-activating enzyme E1 C
MSTIATLLDNVGPYNANTEEYNSAFAHDQLRTCKVLVIGAGGLGCEIIKNLALTGFKDIWVIDMDTIDLSNLNRQFLFRHADIGKLKAEVAAQFVKDRLQDPSLKITPYFGKIQDKTADFYKQFNCIISGLDSVEARRWINATIVSLVDESYEYVIPIIDGGTEGFRGQSRVIIPTITSCYECTLHMLTPKVTYPVCTIANTPRLPEHCIEWANEIEWPKHFAYKFDDDNPDHVAWMYQTALKRAGLFNIEGVTKSLTLGVVKSIIPAIASTNAVIAASCCNEAFKILTDANAILENYMMYSGDDQVFTYTFNSSKNPQCPVCGTQTKVVKCQNWWTLERFIEEMKSIPDIQVKDPSLSVATKRLFFASPPLLYEATKHNLTVKMNYLVEEDEEVAITDSRLPLSLRVRLQFSGPHDEPDNINLLLT